MKKIYGALLLASVLLVSILVTTLPTFFTKGVSRVSMQREFNLPLALNDEKDVKILFFGYSGCTDVCAPRLFSINKFYKTLDEKLKKRVGVEFVDISTPQDESLPSRFAKFFNDDFKGIRLKRDTIREYTKKFNVFFSKSLMNDGEYDHTANLYLVTRFQGKKTIRFAYNAYPYDFKQIKLDLQELTNE